MNEGAAMTNTTKTIILIAALAVATQGTAGDAPEPVDQWGCSAADREIEQFLLTAEITEIEDIGCGITKPKRLTLKQGDVIRRAIYKDVDIHNNEISYTNRFETSFHDSFEYEVAAYRMDRLLGINLVPVTVLRNVDGIPGSVQLWIENAMSLQDIVDSGTDCKDPERLLKKLMLMYVLDAMIFNIDRNYGNVLVDTNERIFYLIDHSRSFRNSKKLPKLQEARPIPIPWTVANNLLHLIQQTLDSRLEDLLTKSQRRAIMKRRDSLVEQLAERSLLPAARVVSAPDLPSPNAA